MAGRLSRGWSMAKASFSVLRQHPKLVVLPIMSGTIFLTIAGMILASLLPQLGFAHNATNPVWNWLGDGQSGNVSFYASAFAVLFVLTAVAIFFNTALIHCALRAHAGEQPSIRGGLAAAVGLLPQILGWALIATTIGVVLNMIHDALKNYLGFLGSFLGTLLELSWSVITYFVVPVLVTEKVGPITAVKRSAAILRSKWGESSCRRSSHRAHRCFACPARRTDLLQRSGDRPDLGRDVHGGARRHPDGAGYHCRRVQYGGHADVGHDLPLRRLCVRHDRTVPPSLDRDLLEGAFRAKA